MNHVNRQCERICHIVQEIFASPPVLTIGKVIEWQNGATEQALQHHRSRPSAVERGLNDIGL